MLIEKHSDWGWGEKWWAEAEKIKPGNADSPWEALSMKLRIEEEEELEQEVSVGS